MKWALPLTCTPSRTRIRFGGPGSQLEKSAWGLEVVSSSGPREREGGGRGEAEGAGIGAKDRKEGGRGRMAATWLEPRDSTPLSLLMTLPETRTTRRAACARSPLRPESEA